MGSGASVPASGVSSPSVPESNYTNNTEQVSLPPFCYEESCLFPETPRYAVDMNSNILDTKRGVLLNQSFRKLAYLAVSMRDTATKKTTR